MERRRFGPTDRKVPVIGQGTWYNDNEDPALAIDALRRGLDLGMTHIDTAEMYGSGAAEDIIAVAIAGRRDEVFLVSKVLPFECLAAGDDRSLRAVARSPRDRPAGLLSLALAGRVSAGGDVLGLRTTSARGEDPLLGREQLRRA